MCVCVVGSVGDCASSPDKLLVRDGDDQSAVVLTVLCGTLNGETVTSTGESLSVELVTDGSRQRQGFAAAFSFVDAASVTLRPGRDRRPTSTTTRTDGERDGSSVMTTVDAGRINVPGTTLLCPALLTLNSITIVHYNILYRTQDS